MPQRRMQPDDRREEILAHARTLLAARPFGEVSTGDIADAAGVTRALVHHYCGGMRDIFLTVAVDLGRAMASERRVGTEVPLQERVATNCASFLDIVGDNRETWLACAGHGAAVPDPQVRALLEGAIEANLDRVLEVNADVLRDTPTTRLALRAYAGLTTSAVRDWLLGRVDRAPTERLLVLSFLDLAQRTVPALEAAATDRRPAAHPR